MVEAYKSIDTPLELHIANKEHFEKMLLPFSFRTV